MLVTDLKMDGKVLLDNEDEVFHAVPQKSSVPPKIFPSPKMIFPHPQLHWFLGVDFGRIGQPVNTSGRNQLKTSFYSIFALN
jgi:hypothetical protein